MKSSLKLSPQMRETVDALGTFIKYWGFRKLDGQIWCLLYLSKEALQPSEMASYLGVSKASITISVKELLEYSVIEERPVSGQKRSAYASSGDIAEVVRGVLRKRERAILWRIDAACRDLKAEKNKSHRSFKISEEKLKSLTKMNQAAQIFLEDLVGENSLLSVLNIFGDSAKLEGSS